MFLQQLQVVMQQQQLGWYRLQQLIVHHLGYHSFSFIYLFQLPPTNTNSLSRLRVCNICTLAFNYCHIIVRWSICSGVRGSIAIRVSISLISFVMTPWCDPLTVLRFSPILATLDSYVEWMNLEIKLREYKVQSTLYFTSTGAVLKAPVQRILRVGASVNLELHVGCHLSRYWF